MASQLHFKKQTLHIIIINTHHHLEASRYLDREARYHHLLFVWRKYLLCILSSTRPSPFMPASILPLRHPRRRISGVRHPLPSIRDMLPTTTTPRDAASPSTAQELHMGHRSQSSVCLPSDTNHVATFDKTQRDSNSSLQSSS